jgi:hypothetical protein
MGLALCRLKLDIEMARYKRNYIANVTLDEIKGNRLAVLYSLFTQQECLPLFIEYVNLNSWHSATLVLWGLSIASMVSKPMRKYKLATIPLLGLAAFSGHRCHKYINTIMIDHHEQVIPKGKARMAEINKALSETKEYIQRIKADEYGNTRM